MKYVKGMLDEVRRAIRRYPLTIFFGISILCTFLATLRLSNLSLAAFMSFRLICGWIGGIVVTTIMYIIYVKFRKWL